MRIILALLLSCSLAGAATTRYLRVGATGAANGANWTDAYTTFAAAETAAARGDLVYVAGGSYSSSSTTFNTAISSTTTIEFRKATVADHGTDTGWSAAYDAQIVTGKLDIDTGYWIFNGAVGHGSSEWYTLTDYGWKVNVSGDNGLQFDNTVSGIQLRYIEVDGNGSGTTSFDGLRANQGGDDWIISHLWIHDFDRCAFKIGQSLSGNGDADNWIVEYVFTDNHSKNGGIHSEMSSTRGTGKFIWRYNFHIGWKSTGCLIVGNGVDWEVYGNVFANDAGSANNGAIGTWSSSSGYAVEGFKIYNNTFWNLQNNPKKIFPIANSSSGHVITNNLWVDCVGTGSAFGAGTDDHNYNAFYNHGVVESESQMQTSFSQNPLSDPANGDFRPSIATTAGLATEFTTDGLGVLYSNGGGWQRGAFAFGEAAPDTTPPNISNLASNTPGAVSATITWNTDDSCSSKVDYGTTASYGSVVSSETLVSSHSVQITGLSAGTVYHFRAVSTNGAGLGTNTADFTFTTAAADSTVPTVSITAPTDSATVSETIAFTADAADNAAVQDVKFYVDDVLVQTDTDAAYGFNWNSRTVNNGSHTLKAIAQDTSANKATNSITVTVSNSDAAPAVWWKFDENTGSTSTDVLAGNVATQVGSSWLAGHSGTAFNFDGVNDYATAPNSVSLNISGTNITVMAWVKITSTDTYQQFVVKGTNTAAPFNAWHIYGQHLTATTWRPHWQITDSTDVRTSATSVDTVNYGDWVHVAGVYNGLQMTLYVNASQGEGTDVTGSLKQYTQPLLLGARGLYQEFMEGLLDDVRIYNRALEASEINSIWYEGLGQQRPVHKKGQTMAGRRR